MTPEQRGIIEDALRLSRAPNIPGNVVLCGALDALLAAHDAQAAELDELRQVLTWAVRDDMDGNKQVGAAVEREVILAMLLEEAAQWQKERDRRMKSDDDEEEPVEEATTVAEEIIYLAHDIRARGPTLPLPDVGELERLRAIDRVRKEMGLLLIVDADGKIVAMSRPRPSEMQEVIQ